MRTMPFATSRSLRIGAVVAFAALFMLAPVGGAQTPEATPMADDAAEVHPAHFHAGSCAELGEVVIPLTDVTVPTGTEHMGADTAHRVKTSHTIVDVPLQEIIDGGHAVNVHESAEAIDVYIACGDVGGVVVEEGGRRHLVIGLAELNDSGHTGVVWMGEDGEQTEVVITLIEPDEMGMDH